MGNSGNGGMGFALVRMAEATRNFDWYRGRGPRVY